MTPKNIKLPFGFGETVNWCCSWGKTPCEVVGYYTDAVCMQVRIRYGTATEFMPVSRYVYPHELERVV